MINKLYDYFLTFRGIVKYYTFIKPSTVFTLGTRKISISSVKKTINRM